MTDSSPTTSNWVDLHQYLPPTPHSMPSPSSSNNDLCSVGLKYPPTPPHLRNKHLNDSAQPCLFFDESIPVKPPQIKLLGIPQKGAKSRVETQIKVIMQLENIEQFSHWKFLRLPFGSASKKRSKKGALTPYDVPRHNTLYLETQVRCATPPHHPVLACTSCRERERKRFQRKREARVRPRPRSDDEDDDPPPGSLPNSVQDQYERNKIILFNCGELVPLNFESAYDGAKPLPTAVLPTRVTCYCRHHREKLGFFIDFTLKQHNGKVIANTTSPPIMITDDHKSTLTRPFDGLSETSTKGKRSSIKSKRGINEKNNLTHSDNNDKKPYSAPNRRKKSPFEFTHLNNSSPSFTTQHDYSSVNNIIQLSTPATTPSPPRTEQIMFDNDSIFNSPNNVYDSKNGFDNQLEDFLDSSLFINSPEENNLHLSPLIDTKDIKPHEDFNNILNDSLSIESKPSTSQIPFNNLLPPSHAPIISRIVPSEGPIRGGIEITILGQNFEDGLTACFGDIQASRTTRWGECTLVCLLPPASNPGPVQVTLKGHNVPEQYNQDESNIFTYLDDSDKALMELALSVLGYNLTGKFEDAKNVAMKIVGGSGTNDSQSQGDNGISNSNGFDLERFIINALGLFDLSTESSSRKSLQKTNKQGQTLLHLSCQMSFSRLTRSLLARGADIDSRDVNGLTPLHVAYLMKSETCISTLIKSGADDEIVDARGYLAHEMTSDISENENESEEDADDEHDSSSSMEVHSNVIKKKINKRPSIQHLPSDASTSTSTSSYELEKMEKDERMERKQLKRQQKAFEVLLTNLSTAISEKTGWGNKTITNENNENENEIFEEDWSTRAKKRAQNIVEDVRLLLFWGPVLLLSLIFSFISIVPFANRVGNQLAPLLGLQANAE